MRILRLRVKGSIGLQKGLGLSEIDLDLSEITGLVALAGDNGKGKSTVLEMLQPYSRMASRKGSLQSHFYGRDGYKDLEFIFQDDTYRTIIKIDSESNRTEGYLWKNGVSEIDGKISNYNRYILNLFGSPELFFNSVFCSQNSRKISDLTTGELKKLFSEFLRLYKLIAYEDTSKQCNNLLTSRANSLDRDIKSLKIVVDSYSGVNAKLSFSKGERAKLEQNLLQLSEDRKTAEDELSAIQADIQGNKVIETELAGLQSAQDRLSVEIENDQKQSESELDVLRIKYRALDLDIVDLGSLLANSVEIREAAKSAEISKGTLAIDRTRIKDIDRAYSAATSAVAKKDTEIITCRISHEKQSNKDKRDKSTLKAKLNHAQLKLIDLDKRDPDCVSKTCSFILSALSAQQDIPEIELLTAQNAEDVAKTEKAYSDMRNRLNAEIRALKAKESGQRAKKEEAETKITESERKLIQSEILASELPKVETALSKKQDLEKRQAENIIEGKRVKASWDKRISDKTEQKTAAAAIINGRKAKLNIEAEENLKVVEQNISDLGATITTKTDEIAAKVADIIRQEQEVARKKQAQEELSIKKTDWEQILFESSEWLYLKNACSATGLRALEIDSVCPTITNYANELLINTFGPAFTVKFRTQTDEGREALDIIAIGDDGSEILLDNLSGGQKTWILSALRLSLTLISKEKDKRSFLTGFADESDGALDVGHAIEYVQMYRAFMKVGGFENFYFISHKPETIALSDHIVKFGNGKITIN